MTFFIACVPPTTTHQSKKIVKVGGFTKLADSDALVSAKGTLDALLVPHQPEKPMAGAIRLGLSFRFPFPKSWSRKKRIDGAPKTTKPDCSNLAKTIEDRLVALGFMEDDAAVYLLEVEKVYDSSPGILVMIDAFPGVLP